MPGLPSLLTMLTSSFFLNNTKLAALAIKANVGKSTQIHQNCYLPVEVEPGTFCEITEKLQYAHTYFASKKGKVKLNLSCHF